jgi:hypothetical protein
MLISLYVPLPSLRGYTPPPWGPYVSPLPTLPLKWSKRGDNPKYKTGTKKNVYGNFFEKSEKKFLGKNL